MQIANIPTWRINTTETINNPNKNIMLLKWWQDCKDINPELSKAVGIGLDSNEKENPWQSCNNIYFPKNQT